MIIVCSNCSNRYYTLGPTIIQPNKKAKVRLKDVDPLAGGIAFEALTIDDKKIPNLQRKRVSKTIRRKVNRNKIGSVKRKKKAKRS